VRQLAVQDDRFADTYQNNQNAKREEPDTMRVETFTTEAGATVNILLLFSDVV
jgi:hypothetical protein